MESLAFGHNFDFYEQAQQQQQQVSSDRLINQDRIDFSQTMTSIGKFGFFLSSTGGAVFLFRLLPVLSFGGFLVRAITICILLKEAVFAENDDDRANYQKILLAVSLGSVGAEWDAILAIGTAVGDFLTLYGGNIIAGLLIATIALLWLIFSSNGGRHNTASASVSVSGGGGDYDDD